MNVSSSNPAGGPANETQCAAAYSNALCAEFQHVGICWCWFFSLGILLAVCGAAAIIFPAITFFTSVVAMTILGICLIVAGVGTIAAALWAGKSSRVLLQLLVGILYLVAGFVMTDAPLRSAVMMAAVFAAMFMIAGAFRAVAAVVVRFPHWGWALLNGLATFLCGAIIYRHFPQSAMWVVGLLVGLEMLLNGVSWIMLSLAIKNIQRPTA